MRDSLAAALRERSARIGVVGAGYVGLPLALRFAGVGFETWLFDTDESKIEALIRSESYIGHIDSATIAECADRLRPTADMTKLGEPDVLLLCIPTPLSAHREPDLRFVERTARDVGATLRSGQLIVLESTTYPGTTRERLLPILAESGLELGTDFFLAFSPEREDPGRDRRFSAIPKIVGGVDDSSAELASALYESIVDRVVVVRNSDVAEATKLTENIFRAVNIALVNELKIVFERMDIDVWEVLDAASTKPFGFMRFNPGPGWGGHCIPLDPFYLSWKARQTGNAPRFIELAGEMNQVTIDWVLGRIAHALNGDAKAIRGSHILVLGVAYKRDVDDARESPAFEILDRLLEAGADVAYHDPHVPRLPRVRRWPDLPDLASETLDEASLQTWDCVVVVTDHAAIDWNLVAAHSRLLVDTRNIIPKTAKARVVRA